MSTPDLLRAALDAAQRGWHVFPLRPDDKRPAVRDWESRATLDADRIRRCWTAGARYNVAVACGPSRLVVVDLDQPKPETAPPPAPFNVPGVNDGADAFALICEQAGQSYPWHTHTLTTGRGGTHLYFRHPDHSPQLRNTEGTGGNGLGWLIDTRAHGGYVVAAGSVVNGRPYTTTCDLEPAELPGWLAKRLTPAPLPPQRPVTVDLGAGRAGAYLSVAIDRQLAQVTDAAAGARNRALYLSAVALGQLAAGGALTTTDVTGLLAQAAHRAGLRPAETARTIASGLRAGAARPRSVAA
jgi:Bifunctional DNA primase/polymerase, N-terminal